MWHQKRIKNGTWVNKIRIITAIHCLCCSFSTHSQHITHRLLQAWNLASNFFTRLDQLTLGRSKPKWSWQHLTTSVLLVLNNFIDRRFTTKSRVDRSDLNSGQASKPYSIRCSWQNKAVCVCVKCKKNRVKCQRSEQFVEMFWWIYALITPNKILK